MQLPNLNIPIRIRDHESFRRWARSPECPEKARFDFYRGAMWLDLAFEELYSHNQVKAEVGTSIFSCRELKEVGRYAVQGMLLSIPMVGLTCMPDGFFVSFASLEAGPGPAHIKPLSA
jgi:hypothetical protein